MIFQIFTPESDIGAAGTLLTDRVFYYFERCSKSFMNLIGYRSDIEMDLFEIAIMPTQITWNVLEVHIDVFPDVSNAFYYLFMKITESGVNVATAKFKSPESDFALNNFFKKHLNGDFREDCMSYPFVKRG